MENTLESNTENAYFGQTYRIGWQEAWWTDISIKITERCQRMKSNIFRNNKYLKNRLGKCFEFGKGRGVVVVNFVNRYLVAATAGFYLITILRTIAGLIFHTA